MTTAMCESGRKESKMPRRTVNILLNFTRDTGHEHPRLQTRVEFLKLGTINEHFEDGVYVWNELGKYLHRERRQG